MEEYFNLASKITNIFSKKQKIDVNKKILKNNQYIINKNSNYDDFLYKRNKMYCKILIKSSAVIYSTLFLGSLIKCKNLFKSIFWANYISRNYFYLYGIAILYPELTIFINRKNLEKNIQTKKFKNYFSTEEEKKKYYFDLFKFKDYCLSREFNYFLKNKNTLKINNDNLLKIKKKKKIIKIKKNNEDQNELEEEVFYDYDSIMYIKDKHFIDYNFILRNK